MYLTRNLETLKNKAAAMNEVNKAILSTAAAIQDLLADKPYDIYKADGSLNKKMHTAIKDILDQACCKKLHSIIIDDDHNSVCLKFTQTYQFHSDSGHISTQYYKETVFIICKGQDTNTDRAKYNVRIPLDLTQYNKRYSAKGLLSQTNKAYAVEQQIQELKSKLLGLTYNLKD